MSAESNVPAHVTAATPWHWTMHDSAGAVVDIGPDLCEAFADQAEAEAWLGEFFGDLADAGVDEVTLHESERTVYGPMSLHA